jgi:hypothetical protein
VVVPLGGRNVEVTGAVTMLGIGSPGCAFDEIPKKTSTFPTARWMVVRAPLGGCEERASADGVARERVKTTELTTTRDLMDEERMVPPCFLAGCSFDCSAVIR